jgi:hypothetical protein
MIIKLVILLTLFPTAAPAARKKPIDLLGLRLGMTEESVHDRLGKIGHQQREEKENEGEGGEQEVWKLKDPRWDYLVAKFDSQHRLLFVTVVVRKDVQMIYGEVAEPKEARYATDGRNHTYSWTIAASHEQPGYLMVARGSDPKYLTSCSLYRLRQKTNYGP